MTLLPHLSERDAETSGQTKASSTVLSRRDLESGAWGELHFRTFQFPEPLFFRKVTKPLVYFIQQRKES